MTAAAHRAGATTELAADQPVLSARGLTRRFGRRVALKEVDLALRPGRVVGLLGANGAGKSTLLSLLAGHLRPSAGQVIWSVAAGAAGQRGRLGMLPQGVPLPPDETPRRFLIQLARLQHAGDPEATAEEVLRALALEGAEADARLRTLSAGERKLVAIGQAFLGAPEVILLDEPTSALDPWGRQRLRAMVRARRDAGAAVLLASHNLGEAEQLCDEAVVLHEGRVQTQGTLFSLMRAADEVRFELGVGGRLPLAELGAALPGVDVVFDPDARTLALAGQGSGRPIEAVVTTTFRILAAAGVQVRRVACGQSLEGALTGTIGAEQRAREDATDASDVREG